MPVELEGHPAATRRLADSSAQARTIVARTPFESTVGAAGTTLPPSAVGAFDAEPAAQSRDIHADDINLPPQAVRRFLRVRKRQLRGLPLDDARSTRLRLDRQAAVAGGGRPFNE